MIALTEAERVALIGVAAGAVPALIGFVGLYINQRRNSTAQRADHANTGIKVDDMYREFIDGKADVREIKSDVREIKGAQKHQHEVLGRLVGAQQSLEDQVDENERKLRLITSKENA